MNAFTPGATVSLSATTSSSRVALSGGGKSVEIQNTGSVTVFVNLGDSSVSAATTDYPVLAGMCKVITRDPNAHTNIAGITASGSATVYFTAGEGV